MINSLVQFSPISQWTPISVWLSFAAVSFLTRLHGWLVLSSKLFFSTRNAEQGLASTCFWSVGRLLFESEFEFPASFCICSDLEPPDNHRLMWMQGTISLERKLTRWRMKANFAFLQHLKKSQPWQRKDWTASYFLADITELLTNYNTLLHRT